MHLTALPATSLPAPLPMQRPAVSAKALAITGVHLPQIKAASQTATCGQYGLRAEKGRFAPDNYTTNGWTLTGADAMQNDVSLTAPATS